MLHQISKASLQILNSRTKTLIAISFLLVVIGMCRWALASEGFTRFLVLGNQFTDKATLPIPAEVSDGSGYDGQFFFRFSLNPFTSQVTEHGITLDRPSYRHQRIAFPLFVHVLSFGQPQLVPLMTVLVGAAALIVVVFIFSSLSLQQGLSPAWGLLVGLTSGLLLAWGRSLAEPLAAAFVAISFYCFCREKLFFAAVALSIAVLTREASVLLAGAGFLTFFSWKTRAIRREIFFFVLPVLVFAVCQWVFYRHWGTFPILNSPSSRGWPFVGFFHQLLTNPYLEHPFESAIQLLYLFWEGWVLAVTLPLVLNRNQSTYIRWLKSSFWLWMLLIVCFSEIIWDDDWGFTRILLEWNLICFAIWIGLGKKPSRPFVALTILLFAGSALRLMLRP